MTTNEMTTLSNSIFSLILGMAIGHVVISIIMDIIINNPFANMKTSKENTVNAIISANSNAYKHLVAQVTIIDMVIDDMYNDPFWAEALNEYAQNN